MKNVNTNIKGENQMNKKIKKPPRKELIGVKVSPQINQKIEELAEQKELSKSEICRRILEKHFDVI